MAVEKEDGLASVTFVFALLIVAVLFATQVNRMKCTNAGYYHSELTKDIDKLKLRLEKAENERLDLISKERLFPIAVQKGYVLKQEGNTYNVIR
jgi:cell division protein FtsL